MACWRGACRILRRPFQSPEAEGFPQLPAALLKKGGGPSSEGRQGLSRSQSNNDFEYEFSQEPSEPKEVTAAAKARMARAGFNVQGVEPLPTSASEDGSPKNLRRGSTAMSDTPSTAGDESASSEAGEGCDEEESAMDALKMAELELEQIMAEQQAAEEKRRKEEDVKQAVPELAALLQKRRQVVDEKGSAFESPRPPLSWRQ